MHQVPMRLPRNLTTMMLDCDISWGEACGIFGNRPQEFLTPIKNCSLTMVCLDGGQVGWMNLRRGFGLQGLSELFLVGPNC